MLLLLVIYSTIVRVILYTSIWNFIFQFFIIFVCFFFFVISEIDLSLYSYRTSKIRLAPIYCSLICFVASLTVIFCQTLYNCSEIYVCIVYIILFILYRDCLWFNSVVLRIDTKKSKSFLRIIFCSFPILWYINYDMRWDRI